jgi:predicted RNA-binding protein YlxR (DUF448 family)
MENKKVKKIPLRKCLGCMESFPKKELVRVVRTPDGEVCIDLTGKKSGRGAYICKSETCFKKAVQSKRIQSNLEITLTDELTEALAKEISGENE